jgi:hypothetical protein
MTIYQRPHAQHYTVRVVPKLVYEALTEPLGPRVCHSGNFGCKKCSYDHLSHRCPLVCADHKHCQCGYENVVCRTEQDRVIFLLMFLRTSLVAYRRIPTNVVQTGAFLTHTDEFILFGYQVWLTRNFPHVSLSGPSQKCFRTFILNCLSIFLCQSPKNIYMLQHAATQPHNK